jgi:glycosyltransferase involved in cell wall biosynthesis
MNIVLLTHPEFIGSQSQSRFAHMLLKAYRQHGHQVELRQPRPYFIRLAGRGKWAKWAGYVDQYAVFPYHLRRQAIRDPADTLYVYCDQALGPWVPLLCDRPHVVHCHDLLALRSALGLVSENPTRFSGRVYQRYIRAGFRKAKHFISISQQTRDDLCRYGRVQPVVSEVVYNGLNHPYTRLDSIVAKDRLRRAGFAWPAQGVLMHVGGGQWYKNAEGVIAIYGALAARLEADGQRVPLLWMVSPQPRTRLKAQIDSLPSNAEVRVTPGLDTELLEALYSLSECLLFPSLAEGFGWPIAEALVCGCPVLTTGEPPMTEVGGEHAHYLRRLRPGDPLNAWAVEGADVIQAILGRDPEERGDSARTGALWAERYRADVAIQGYLTVYQRILAESQPAASD